MGRTVMGGATKPEEREGPGRAGPGRVRGGARRTWWSGPAEGRERENLLRRPVPMSNSRDGPLVAAVGVWSAPGKQHVLGVFGDEVVRRAGGSGHRAVGASPGAGFEAAPEVEVKNGQAGTGPVGAVGEDCRGALESVIWLESAHGGFRCGERGEPPGGGDGAGEDSYAVRLVLGSPADGFCHAVVWGEEKDEVWPVGLTPGAPRRGPGWVEKRVTGFGSGFWV